MSNWTYKGEEVLDLAPYVGFVYQITNLKTGRKYIGKKVAFYKKTRMKKGKKIRVHEDSGWQDYHGSSDELLADVKELGQDQFKREILKLCATKAEMTYFESKLIFEADALLKEDYYNSWVMCRVATNQLKSLIKP